MKRKASYGRRLGNPFRILLRVDATSLEGRLADYDVAVTMVNETKGKRLCIPSFSVDGNEISFEFTAEDQEKAGGTGYYTPTLTLNDEAIVIGTRDWFRCIEIVAHSVQEYSEFRPDVDADIVALVGDIKIGADGLSAYEVWLANGHTGTVQDYLAWLREPAEELLARVILLAPDAPFSPKVWVGSQAQYEAIPHDAHTLYFIPIESESDGD